MNKQVSARDLVILDSARKREKAREFLAEKGYDGLLISTREHFAWVTSGGDSHVLRNSNIGFGCIVITPEYHYLVAHTMDAERLYREQVDGQDYELIPVRWYEGDITQKALALAGKRVAADTNVGGAQNVYQEIVDMHYPMSELEIARLSWLGQKTDELFTDLALSVYPGQTEREIAAALHCAHLQAGMEVDVLIVGSDQRCFDFRHPLPTDKPLEKYLMLHSSARKWGLHSNLTRFVHFSTPPATIRGVHDAVNNVAAKVILSLNPGVKFKDIFAWQKKWYAEEGFQDEWENHFQGGPTGYVVVDAERCWTEKVVQINQPYEWFITITGAKAGELVALTKNGVELFSYQSSRWPKWTFSNPRFGELSLPDIMIRD